MNRPSLRFRLVSGVVFLIASKNSPSSNSCLSCVFDGRHETANSPESDLRRRRPRGAPISVPREAKAKVQEGGVRQGEEVLGRGGRI